MKTSIRLVLGLALIGAMSAAPVIVMAQDEKMIPSLDLDQADVRDALKIIFKVTGYSYSVDPAVQGVVTVHLQNKNFETVLRNVLNQVSATYRLEGGIYNIVPRPVVQEGINPGGLPITAPNVQTVRKIIIRHADPALVLALLSGSTSIGSAPETTALRAGTGGGGSGGGSGFGAPGGGSGGRGNFGGSGGGSGGGGGRGGSGSAAGLGLG